MNRRYQQGMDRHQGMLLPPSIDEYVSQDNPVRVIDKFVDNLDLCSLGFMNTCNSLSAGQPAYNPGDLLKLYIYRYLNHVRSSRCLERETHRNLEVIFLLKGLHPSYKTISDFRKNNPGALKKMNRDFVLFCKDMDLSSMGMSVKVVS